MSMTGNVCKGHYRERSKDIRCRQASRSGIQGGKPQYKRRWKMTAIANKSEEDARTKPRRFWWAKGHPPE